jgi:hypothetical protein
LEFRQRGFAVRDDHHSQIREVIGNVRREGLRFNGLDVQCSAHHVGELGRLNVREVTRTQAVSGTDFIEGFGALATDVVFHLLFAELPVAL